MIYYRNSHGAKDIISCISADLEAQLVAEIKAAKFYSLIIDESTDISTESHLVIYAKYLDHKNSDSKTAFLKLLKLPAGTAAAIYLSVSNYLTAQQLSPLNIVGFGSDGCSTMMGRNNGVYAKFRKDNPYILQNHCFMHRLQLCIKDANDLGIVTKINTLVSDIYVYFCRSAKRTAELENAQKDAVEPGLQVLKLYEIRWLSLYKCVTRLRKIYLSLLNLFGAKTDDFWCAHIYNRLRRFEVIGFIFFLSDSHVYLEKLRGVLEAKSSTYATAMEMIRSVFECLEENCLTEFRLGTSLSALVRILLGNDRKFGKHEILFDKKCNNMRQLKFRVYKYIYKFKSSINDRFSVDPVLSAFRVFDFNHIKARQDTKTDAPRSKESSESDSFQVLKAHFGETSIVDGIEYEPLVNSLNLKVDYDIYGKMLTRKINNKEIQNNADYTNWMHENSQLFESLFTLYTFSQIMPVNSADCERGFSTQNLIKTKHRASLNIETLDWLMRISILGPELEKAKFENAMDLFESKKSRAIFK